MTGLRQALERAAERAQPPCLHSADSSPIRKKVVCSIYLIKTANLWILVKSSHLMKKYILRTILEWVFARLFWSDKGLILRVPRPRNTPQRSLFDPQCVQAGPHHLQPLRSIQATATAPPAVCWNHAQSSNPEFLHLKKGKLNMFVVNIGHSQSSLVN